MTRLPQVTDDGGRTEEGGSEEGGSGKFSGVSAPQVRKSVKTKTREEAKASPAAKEVMAEGY